MKTESFTLPYLIVVFFIVTSVFNGYSQKFDEEYSYEQYLNNTNYLHLLKETSDTVFNQKLIENPSQKSIQISNKAIGNIIFYFNKLEKDFICDSIISNYYFCECGEDATKYYSENEGMYEKGYLQIKENVFLGLQRRLGIEVELFGGSDTKVSKVRQLSVFKNRTKDYCVTIKREVVTMSTKEFKAMKKRGSIK